jgi:phasin
LDVDGGWGRRISNPMGLVSRMRHPDCASQDRSSDLSDRLPETMRDRPAKQNTVRTPLRKCANAQPKLEDGVMMEPKLEVPTELRDLAEKTIEQAEKAFGMFFDAANKSIASVPSPGTEMSKQALSLTEQNMKAAFDHARKLVHATDLQQAMQIQSEFLKSQFTNAGEHMRQITGGVMSAVKGETKS